MNKNPLIIRAGALGISAKEIAENMEIFEKAAFVDDEYETTPNGIAVIGIVCDVDKIVTLVSSHTYVSASPQTGKGSIVEPKAVICCFDRMHHFCRIR